jgi:hypothetical protein
MDVVSDRQWSGRRDRQTRGVSQPASHCIAFIRRIHTDVSSRDFPSYSLRLNRRHAACLNGPVNLNCLARCCVFTAASFIPIAPLGAANVGVAVVHSAEWSPGDAAREGAGEFLVLLQAAKLQRTTVASGLIAVGDRNGMLRSGGERALRRLALTGIVVARTATGGEVAATPDELFLDAGQLSEEQVQRILTRGLQLYGASPEAAEPDRPTTRELAAIRDHLKKFQALFAGEVGVRVALR